MGQRLLVVLRNALVISLLGAVAACASVPQTAPDCHGVYTPINSPDHYHATEKSR